MLICIRLRVLWPWRRLGEFCCIGSILKIVVVVVVVKSIV